MSRAFTSEEYEQREVVIEIEPERKKSADADLVFAYSKGRDFSDPALPYELGMHFLNGDDGFFQSDDFAVKWLSKSVHMGCFDAVLPLATLYLKDPHQYGYGRAADLLKGAADSGSAEARSILDPSGKDPKSKASFTAFRLNAELGNADSMFSLAEGFEKGYYGKNKGKAAKIWYLRAYKAGRKDAAERLYALHSSGRITLSDDELSGLF